MKKILVVTYYWPPSGGAGVQRWLKFSRYLPQSDWEPVILTVDPAFATYPALDPSLEYDIPDRLKVHRVKAKDWFRLYAKDKSKVPSAGFARNHDDSLKGRLSRFIRGNLFIPDPRRGWNRFAFREAVRIIHREGINTVVTTSPPHSSQLIGLRIKKVMPEIKWIADLRDPWTDIYYYDLFYPTLIARSIDRYYEKKVLKKADILITVGHNLAETYISKNEGIREKFRIIPNGYDEEDFTRADYRFPDRFTITYTGTLSEAYPVDGLLDALNRLKNNGHDFLLRFVGFVPEGIKARIMRSVGHDRTEFISYTDHKKAVKYIAESSLLLLVIPDHKKNRAITSGKIFEYIATLKPILYIGPADGDAAFHLKACGHDAIFSGKNSGEISRYIERRMKEAEPRLNKAHPEYSRKILALNLGRVLNE